MMWTGVPAVLYQVLPDGVVIFWYIVERGCAESVQLGRESELHTNNREPTASMEGWTRQRRLCRKQFNRMVMSMRISALINVVLKLPKITMALLGLNQIASLTKSGQEIKHPSRTI